MTSTIVTHTTTYNLLDLPQQETVGSTIVIDRKYGADGMKLQEKVTTNSNSVLTRDYVGSLIYENGTLKKILFDGGYVDMTGSTPAYRFFLTDHLGSVRVVAAADGTVMQVNHYYPYGGLMTDPRHTISSPAASDSRYRFIGKELSEESGEYDFGARYLDPAPGRFTTLDPLAEKYYNLSPYAYCAGNPIRLVDSDGRTIKIKYKGEDIEYRNGGLYDSSGEYHGRIKGFLKRSLNALNSIRKTDIGNKILSDLVDSPNVYFIMKRESSSFQRDNAQKAFAEQYKSEYPLVYNSNPSLFEGGSGGTIFWDSKGAALPTTKGVSRHGISDLFHEMAHAHDANGGLLNDQFYNGVKISEWRAVYFENLFRQQFNLPYRTHYIKVLDNVSSSISGGGPSMLDSNGNPFIPKGL